MDSDSSTSYATSAPSPDPSKIRLDHIIILLPYKDLIDLPSHFTDNFTITPGGRHADGKTENKLILFHDGSYVELIAFIDDSPEHKKDHWWGEKLPGLIDYAFTTDGDATTHWKSMQARLEALSPDLAAKYSYALPVAGGRLRDDGVDVKWQVTFPKGAPRGVLPFFCHDVTARDGRVPLSDKACTHPCGAYGLRWIDCDAPDSEELRSVYSAILGSPIAHPSSEAEFAVSTVRVVEGAHAPGLRPFHFHRSDSDLPPLAHGSIVLGRFGPPCNQVDGICPGSDHPLISLLHVPRKTNSAA